MPRLELGRGPLSDREEALAIALTTFAIEIAKLALHTTFNASMHSGV